MIPARLLLFISLGLAVSTASAIVGAQTRTPRIGYLTSGGCPTAANASGFLEGLEDRGYVFGRNLDIECRQAEESSDRRFHQLAGELVRLNVALVVAVSSAAVRGIRSVSHTIPVVALDLETDPVRSGLATSLGRPGGNVTGIFLDAEQMYGKRLQMLREILPRLARVAALWDASLDPAQLRSTETMARAFGVGFQALSVREPKEFAAAFGAARRGRADAILIMEGPFMNVNAKQIADLALQGRLPSIGIFPSFVKEGGLMSYGPDVQPLFKQATSYIERMLKGARPSDLPIERPTHFYAAVNLKTARAVGVTIPSSLLAQANYVIE